MLEIRQAHTKDLTLLTHWTYLLHCHEDDGVIATHPEFKSRLEEWLAAELTNSNGLFLVATIKNKPIGFIHATSIINDNGFLASPMKGMIHLLWIEPEFRQQQVAKTLTEATEACFKDLGIGYVECAFTVKNQLAESFWFKQGYLPYSTTARKVL